MAKKPPAIVVVVAVLQLVFGGLGLIEPILYFTGAQRAVSSWMSGLSKGPGATAINQQKVEEEVTRRVPWFPTFTLAVNLVVLLLCVLLIAGGIGLLKVQKWAWWLTMLYVLLSIAYRLTQVILLAGFITPVMADLTIEAMQQAMAQAPRGGGAGPPPGFFDMMRTTMSIAPFLGLIVLVYPITIGILMLQRSARTACLGGGPDQDADRDRSGAPREGEVADRGNAPTEPDDRSREE
jgi:hypothetical protein